MAVFQALQRQQAGATGRLRSMSIFGRLLSHIGVCPEKNRLWRWGLGLAVVFFWCANPAYPELTTGDSPGPAEVEIELAVDPRLPPLTQHEWARELNRLGLTRVRIRTAFPSDQPRVETIQTLPYPKYRVLGVVSSTNELNVPGARFTLRQLAGFVRWIDELRLQGPPETRPRPVAFGLDLVRFQLVKQELAQPVTVSTKNRPAPEVISEILSALKTPVQWEERTKQQLSDRVIAEELKGLAIGTSLAYLLRYDGLALVPRTDLRGVKYVITKGGKNLGAWPVGWTPEDGEAKAFPRLMEFLTVNIENVNLPTVLQSLEKRLEVVCLFDYPALARFGIELEKTSIKLPQTKTTYAQVLRRSLFQAGLKGEIRLDDADKPFVWISTLRPVEEK